MNWQEHIKNENLEQLVSAWASLTPAQRKVLRLRAQFILLPILAKKFITKVYYGFPRLLNKINQYFYPAHWI